MSDPILGAILEQDAEIDRRANEIATNVSLDELKARAAAIAEARARERTGRMFFSNGRIAKEIKKVYIRRDTNGDTRVAKEIPSIELFERANCSHRGDVEQLVSVFNQLLEIAGRQHDWTKTDEPYRSLFYRDLVATMEGRLKFEDGEWARYHYDVLERHHLARRVPEDVNLVDVIEMICDCVAAGMARSGDIYPIEISSDTLQKAVKNTIVLLKGYIEVQDDKVTEASPC